MLALLALTLAGAEPVAFPDLDAAIRRCDREIVLPVFAAELERRTAMINGFYQEQALIVRARAETSDKRRMIREAGEGNEQALPAPPLESDQQLALRQLALDDRQRRLDDERKLEAMRQEAIDLNRQHFLARCPSGRGK